MTFIFDKLIYWTFGSKPCSNCEAPVEIDGFYFKPHPKGEIYFCSLLCKNTYIKTIYEFQDRKEQEELA